MPWAVYSTGTNCLPLLLFLISLSLVTSGIAWLHTLGVCGLDLLFVFVWLCERLVCLYVDCLVVTLRVRVFWIVVVVQSRCPPAWLTRPHCPLLGARQQSPGRGTAFCHLFLFSLSFSVLFLVKWSDPFFPSLFPYLFLLLFTFLLHLPWVFRFCPFKGIVLPQIEIQYLSSSFTVAMHNILVPHR